MIEVKTAGLIISRRSDVQQSRFCYTSLQTKSEVWAKSLDFVLLLLVGGINKQRTGRTGVYSDRLVLPVITHVIYTKAENVQVRSPKCKGMDIWAWMELDGKHHGQCIYEFNCVWSHLRHYSSG
jgi:hypothetical protein